MAGRKKQPLSVINGKGKSKHITKAVEKDRQEQEDAMKGFTDNIEPPSWLLAAQKKEFMRVAEELVRLNIFSNLDVDFLAMYIDSKDEHVKLTKSLRKLKKTINIDSPDGTKEIVANENYMKLRRTKNLTFNECKSAASELGLSITSRLKLIIPKTDEDKAPKTEAERRFGNRL